MDVEDTVDLWAQANRQWLSRLIVEQYMESL